MGALELGKISSNGHYLPLREVYSVRADPHPQPDGGHDEEGLAVLAVSAQIEEPPTDDESEREHIYEGGGRIVQNLVQGEK